MSSEIDVRLRGLLEVEVSGERVRFEGVKQRRLFVLLALPAPETVSAADLAEGRDADLVGELQALVAAHPFRERMRGQLMLALGCGPVVA